MQFGLLYIIACNLYILPCCCPVPSAAGSCMATWLHSQAITRLEEGLRPRTRTAYMAAFRQFLAFVIVMKLDLPCTSRTVLSYLEFLAQNGLRATSLKNHLSTLKHFFALFEWPTYVFHTRKVSLFVKSVQNNAPLNVKITGVFSVPMLRKLICAIQRYTNAKLYTVLFLTAFFGFFRLASLLPNAVDQFDRTRHFIQNDLVFGPPGLHLIMTYTKTMQTSGQVQVVQLPQLNDPMLCPVTAFKDYLASVPIDKTLPLFQILVKQQWLPLTGFKARSFLKLAVTSIGLDPKIYTFHSFRRSGASLAFNHDVDLNKIKQHGNWKSDAIWTYLRNTPKAASTIPTTFAKLISTT